MITNLKDVRYILDENGNPVVEHDLMKWAEWFETHNEERRVAYDQIGSDPQNNISTVFLGLDYSFKNTFVEGSENPPILYETMIFGCGDRDNDTYRYATKEEALSNHNILLAELNGKK